MRNIKKYSSILFIVAEIVLWICILNISGIANKYLSFSAVVLAFLFAMMFFGIKNKNYLTNFALLFTVIADVFLVLLDAQNQSAAMTSFTVVQILYFIRILFETKNKKVNYCNIFIRIALVVAVEVVTIVVLKDKTDYLSIISMFYYVNLILNVIFAFINFKNSKLLALGLLFFLCCDTFVGLQCAIGTYINVGVDTWFYKLVFAPFNFVWFFYVPAQTLLALSVNKKTSNC